MHSIVRVDEFPVNEKVALQLAGLQAQILWGEADAGKMSRYEELDKYLPWRVRQGSPQASKNEWMTQLFTAHKTIGGGRTDLQAKVLYLTAIMQYPLYGGTLFEVQYKGFWPFPNRIFVSVHVDGFKFVHPKTKEVLADFPYAKLHNLEVNAYEDTLTFHMVPSSPDELANFQFDCTRKEDLAGLIASYSPAHRNWKQVGLAPSQHRHVTEEDKLSCLADVQKARLNLAQEGMLLKPVEAKGSFLATTLRRRGSIKSKLMAISDDSQFSEFEKTFDHRFWSYSKTKLTQSLSVVRECVCVCARAGFYVCGFFWFEEGKSTTPPLILFLTMSFFSTTTDVLGRRA